MFTIGSGTNTLWLLTDNAGTTNAINFIGTLIINLSIKRTLNI